MLTKKYVILPYNVYFLVFLQIAFLEINGASVLTAVAGAMQTDKIYKSSISMKKILTFVTLAALAAAAQAQTVTSPDGQVKLDFKLTPSGQP